MLVDCCIALRYSSDVLVLLDDIPTGNVEATFHQAHPSTAARFTFAAARKVDVDIGLSTGCQIRRYAIYILKYKI